jgi:hypothetical protein
MPGFDGANYFADFPLNSGEFLGKTLPIAVAGCSQPVECRAAR